MCSVKGIKIITGNQSLDKFLPNRMTSQEFILIPKENYIKQQPKSSEILEDATINEKAKLLTLLQRNKPPEEPKEKSEATSSSPATDREIIEKRVLKSLSMMKPWQLEKSKPILRKIYDSSDVSINEDGFLTLDDRPTSLEATSFLYNLQQPKTGLHDPDYRRILSKIDISPQLVPNSDAKKILQPLVVKKKITTGSKNKTPKKRLSKKALSGDESSIEALEEETSAPRRWDRL